MSHYSMSAKDVVALVERLDAHGVDACVGGGWGVDALLGEQTREHSDLDVWAPAAHLESLFVAFAEAGVDRIFPWPGDRPWNFVLHDGVRLRVDLHLYEPLADGSLHYGSVVEGGPFPAEALAGRGSIAGTAVRCESAEWAVRWHTGYPARDVDRHDVPLLCQRFGIPLPEGFEPLEERSPSGPA
ncbi:MULTISPECIES: nucleotidyltransferase domain-containing protein [Streptomyces]|uniref:Lincosamide nucleotidyltransferase A/C/D/E n=1 Tax=Streptomyces achromogenes TaxID=67255 RepID=A0ABU0Q9E0_STRAH|nr:MULTISPECIES: aminoglycoside nucleotidyltransferase [Streptomyces]MCZ4507831.1 aminoglycoside nucleotidyltransferase [Streptomyces sp. ActVer]MDQ0687276.1 lincosamide nucleotidyltransferase A/C/D/E [Streptomyces achromogenes]MDX3115090.1 aminoglycoside nucleotidyltransferase [Streptomyces scabiei]MDX3243511.1 aminoglycoside nucleotidyltransferase [Streptomyces sp. ME18-1-4]